MKHIVFILGSYYPNCSAVGKCIGNLAECLGTSYRVTVISIYTSCEEQSIEKFKGQMLHRVKTKELVLRLKLKNVKNKFSKFCLQGLRGYSFLKVIFSNVTFNENLVKAYLSELNSIKEPIDIIIPTCSPMESTIAALRFKKNADYRVKVFPILFDLFAANARLNRFEWNKKLKFSKNKKIEKSILEQSDWVFFVHNWEDYLKKNFKELMDYTTEIEHPLMKLPSKKLINDSEHDAYAIVYTGTIDLINRNPKFALDILTKISREIPIRVKIFSFGTAQSIVHQYAGKYPKVIVEFGQVNTECASAERNKANFLLSIGNKDTKQLPSKIFEYIATGKPIIHFAYSHNDPTINVLKKYRLSIVIEKGQIDDNKMKELKCFIKKYNRCFVSFEEIRKKYIEALPETVCSKLGRHF